MSRVYAYNTEEQLTSLRNEVGERYSFTRDKAGRINAEIGCTPVEMYDEQGKKAWETRLDIYGKIATFEGGSLTAC